MLKVSEPRIVGHHPPFAAVERDAFNAFDSSGLHDLPFGWRSVCICLLIIREREIGYLTEFPFV